MCNICDIIIHQCIYRKVVNMNGYTRYENMLIDKGIRPSSQRILMIEYLDKNHNHPTADKIYSELLEKLPSISKATVYNNLNLFVEKDILKKISSQSNEISYDINNEPHGHFICDLCDAIYDFDISDVNLDSSALEGFKVENQEIIFRGECKNCSS